MRRHYFFRKGEIVKWLEAYRQSKEYVRLYKYYLSDEQKMLQRDEFLEADRIVREYWVLRCSVEEYERELLERFVSKEDVDDKIAILQNPNIIENWEQIVLSTGDHSFSAFDPVAFGNRLKEMREVRCMYRAEAARYLEISENTLRSYEDGRRIIRIDIFIRILELYGLSFYDFFNAFMMRTYASEE